MESSASFRSRGRIRDAVWLASCLTVCCAAAALAGCSSGSYNNQGDTTPPSAPANLTANAASSTQINLTWSASTDNVGVAGYQIQRCTGAACANFAQVATTTTAITFNDTGLTASTSYSYRVSAKDAANNVSAFSNSATATTKAASDTTPPTTPTNLTATAASSTQINLAWTASTDNVGVTGYQIQRCQAAGCSNFAQVGTSTTASFNDTSLTASTSYSYRVSAKDAANNVSAFSNTATATTQASGAAISVSITPRRGGLTITQTLPVTATVQNDGSNQGVTWSVTGGGSFSVTSSLSGVPVTFTAPGTAGSVTVTATSRADTSKTASATIGVTDLAAVSTYQNDGQRTGQNLKEYALSPSTVTAATFGKLFSCSTTEGGTVPGHIYAQPLYVTNLTIGAAKHNVLFVVTESDWVYAFDADANPCVTLWKASMLSTAHGAISGETTVPAGDTGEPDDLHPEIGITSTPVIDAATNTIYLTAKSKESSSTYHHRLHALSLVDGSEKFAGPVDITATGFSPLIHMQRPALLLSGNNVYLGFGSHGDQSTYHGWLTGYNKTTLAQSSLWTATDLSVGTSKGAIWQAGSGPAVDANGNIWVEVANGDFDGTINFGDSVVKLNLAANAAAGFFTPKDQDTLRAGDIDLGSGGVTILPDSVGSAAHPHLALATGKPNLLYLLDQANLGQFSSTTDNIVQEVILHNGLNEANVIGGMFSKAAYFNGRIYVLPISDVLRAYSISTATLTPVATAADTFGFPGATPSVSALNTTNGIIWIVNTTNNNSLNGSQNPGAAVLFAYDATTLTRLFSGPTVTNAVKFVVPTIANGKVYVPAEGSVTVFGLLP
jgi:chitodextrinase